MMKFAFAALTALGLALGGFASIGQNSATAAAPPTPTIKGIEVGPDCRTVHRIFNCRVIVSSLPH